MRLASCCVFAALGLANLACSGVVGGDAPPEAVTPDVDAPEVEPPEAEPPEAEPPRDTRDPNAEVLPVGQILVLGGGASQDEAAAWVDRWHSVMNPLMGLFTPAMGYPRIVDGSTLEGAAAEAHVAVLGVCADDDAGAVLAAVQSVFPSSELRPIRQERVGCPTVGASLTQSAHLADGARRMSLGWWTEVSRNKDRAVVVLFEDDLAIDHEKRDLQRGFVGEGSSLEVEVTVEQTDDALVLRSVETDSDWSSGRDKVTRKTWTFSIDDEQISVDHTSR